MSNFPIIELDTIDSTNNYAMQLIDANKAQHGMAIVAQSQTGGKGQRGKTWVDEPGKSLLMSIIITPGLDIRRQFEFNAAVAVSIANVLQKLSGSWNVAVKWPNDIIINDKKAAGILIENILRGQNWTHSVIGVGLNVKQENFPQDLPFATSLTIESGLDFDMVTLRDDLRDYIVFDTQRLLPQETIFKRYNEYLYKKGCKQKFSDKSGMWEATIMNALPDGTLEVKTETGETVRYFHGQVGWEWGG